MRDKTYYTGMNDLESASSHNQGLASNVPERASGNIGLEKEYQQFRSAFKAEIAIRISRGCKRVTGMAGDSEVWPAKVKKNEN